MVGLRRTRLDASSLPPVEQAARVRVPLGNISNTARPIIDGTVRSPSPRAKGTKRRKKPSRLFFVTVSLIEPFSSNPERSKRGLVDSSVSLTAYAVATERNSTSQLVSIHLHAFLHTEEPHFVNEIRKLVSAQFPDCRIDCQACRSERNTLIYISKEDVHLYTNISESKFALNDRLWHWAARTQYFSLLDPFVVSNVCRYRFLQQYHSEHLMQNKTKATYKPVDMTHAGWALEVAQWRNRIITGSKKEKRRALYLHGPTNLGKSCLIERVIGRNMMPFVYYPDVGKFCMQCFRSWFHKVILFEEFKYEYHCVSMLKRLCENKNYSYPIKGLDALTMTFQGPIIFISNDPLETITDEAFLSRLNVVSVFNTYWAEPEVRARVKTETDDPPSVDVPPPITISSDSSSDSEHDSPPHSPSPSSWTFSPRTALRRSLSSEGSQNFCDSVPSSPGDMP